MDEVQKNIQTNFNNRLRQQAIFSFSQVNHLLSQRVNQEFFRLNFPLQMDQLPVLFIVYLSEDNLLSQQEIANMLRRDKSGIQRAIRTLERDGYIRIVEDKADRRKNLIRMTPPGRLVIEQAQQITTLVNDEIMGQLTPQEQENLAAITQKLTNLLIT